MQTFKVTGGFVTIGFGIEMELSADQIQSRIYSIKKKKNNIYEVVEPIQFKQGEIITICASNLTKSVLDNLLEISDKKTKNHQTEIEECHFIKSTGFGKYNVFDKNKNLITKKPVKKEEAESILAKIIEEKQEEQTNNKQPENNKSKEINQDLAEEDPTKDLQDQSALPV